MAVLTNRFGTVMDKADVYQEIYAHLATMKNEDMQVPFDNIRLDLLNSNVIIGGETYSLSKRAESMLCSRLDIGNIHNILGTPLYNKVEKELNDYVTTLEGDLVLKHRGGIVQAVVSEKYREIPYDASVNVLEDIGARPIRVTTNDAILKVQAIFDAREFDYVDPADGEAVSMGVQMQSSDVGASSLQFDVFTYRHICGNGMIFGKNSIFKFRQIHVRDRFGTAAEVDKEVKRVLEIAKREIERRTNELIKMKVDRKVVVDFLARQPFGKKALAMLAERVVVAQSMYDVVNILTEEGHNPNHSASLQQSFEAAAGQLMLIAA